MLKRRLDKGFRFAPDEVTAKRIGKFVYYEDTPDQTKSTSEVKADMKVTVQWTFV
jgi:transcription-repair coupling factor (superfamily II helicase)